MIAPWCLLDEPYNSHKKESFEYGNIERGGEENRLAEPAYLLYTPTTPCSAGSHVTASKQKEGRARVLRFCVASRRYDWRGTTGCTFAWDVTALRQGRKQQRERV